MSDIPVHVIFLKAGGKYITTHLTPISCNHRVTLSRSHICILQSRLCDEIYKQARPRHTLPFARSRAKGTHRKTTEVGQLAQVQ
jgi:hypothetical protein